MGHKIITFEKWAEEFKPTTNHMDDNASYDGAMFETYGDELDHVRVADKFNIWTLISGDNGSTWIISGYHLVNRMGYFITEKPFEDDEIEVYAGSDYELDETPKARGFIVQHKEGFQDVVWVSTIAVKSELKTESNGVSDDDIDWDDERFEDGIWVYVTEEQYAMSAEELFMTIKSNPYTLIEEV
jgi:hypothetical protein